MARVAQQHQGWAVQLGGEDAGAGLGQGVGDKLAGQLRRSGGGGEEGGQGEGGWEGWHAVNGRVSNLKPACLCRGHSGVAMARLPRQVPLAGSATANSTAVVGRPLPGTTLSCTGAPVRLLLSWLPLLPPSAPLLLLPSSKAGAGGRPVQTL